MSAKSRTDLTFASASSSQRVSTEMLLAMTGMKMTHVFYRSGPNAMQDLIAGRVTLFTADLGVMLARTDVRKNQPQTAAGCMSADTDSDCGGLFASLGLPHRSSTGADSPRFFSVSRAGSTVMNKGCTFPASFGCAFSKAVSPAIKFCISGVQMSGHMV